jgi:large subunit ribosomal protein L30
MATLQIKQVKSSNGSNPKQRASLRTLGLGKIGRTTEREETPQVAGMLRKVRHLVRVEES